MKQLDLPDTLAELRELRFAAWLRKRFFKEKLTYPDLADLVGLSLSTVGNHLNGVYLPNYDSAIAYFRLFKVPDTNMQHARMYEIFRQVEAKYKKLKRIEDREKEKMILEIL